MPKGKIATGVTGRPARFLARACYGAMLALSFAVSVQADSSKEYIVTAEEWSRPRRGDTVVAIPVLQQVVRQLQSQPTARLVLHHAGGDDGTIWAEQIRSWLVALGVPGDRISLRAGLERLDRIELIIEGGEAAQ